MEYTERDESLAKLGFSNYGDYLQSKLWLGIRYRVLKRDRHICRMCEERAWQVHHQRYDLATMSGRDLRRLNSLCGNCHEKLEFDGATKRSAEEVRRLTGPACVKIPSFIAKKNTKPIKVRKGTPLVQPIKKQRVNTSQDPILLRLRSTPTGKPKKRK